MARVPVTTKLHVILLAVCALGALSEPTSARAAGCSQPVSVGPGPTATDCLFILNAAVGVSACSDPCECAPKGVLPPSATDALLCLSAATGQSTVLQCPCQATTSTTSTTLSACSGPSEGGYLAGITDAHNDVRAAALPAPDPALGPLCWSSSVATVSQAWADNCTWQHNPGRGDLGENIFAGSGDWRTTGALSAVELWAAEVEYYDYATNSCQSGEVCGHYTQIVWRNSEDLGCGIKLCNSGSPFGGGTWTFVVCNYGPPGNWVGQKPY